MNAMSTCFAGLQQRWIKKLNTVIYLIQRQFRDKSITNGLVLWFF